MLAVAAAVIRTTAFQNGPSIGWMRLYGAPRETMQDLLEDNSMLFGSLAPVFTRGGMGIFSRSIIVSIRPVEGGCYVASVCPMDSQLRLWAGLLVLNLCCAVLCWPGVAQRILYVRISLSRCELSTLSIQEGRALHENSDCGCCCC